MPNLVELIKKAAIEAVAESKPTAIVYGKVISIEPLQVQIDQKLILGSAQLILTNDVRDHNVEMTVNYTTEIASSHSHNVIGKKTFIVHNALKVNDGVLMVQVQGGQKFVIIEKVVNA